MTNEQNSTCFFLLDWVVDGGWMDGIGRVEGTLRLFRLDWWAPTGVPSMAFHNFIKETKIFFYSSCVCAAVLSCGFDLALVAALREWIAKFRLPPEGDFLEWRRSCTTPPRLFLPSPPGLLSSSYLLLNPKKKRIERRSRKPWKREKKRTSNFFFKSLRNKK